MLEWFDGKCKYETKYLFKGIFLGPHEPGKVLRHINKQSSAILASWESFGMPLTASITFSKILEIIALFKSGVLEQNSSNDPTKIINITINAN